MIIREVVRFETSDGQLWVTRSEALEHASLCDLRDRLAFNFREQGYSSSDYETIIDAIMENRVMIMEFLQKAGESKG